MKCRRSRLVLFYNLSTEWFMNYLTLLHLPLLVISFGKKPPYSASNFCNALSMTLSTIRCACSAYNSVSDGARSMLQIV